MNNDNKKSTKKQMLIALVVTVAILLINSFIHQYQYCNMIYPKIPLSASPYSHWVLDNLKNSYLGIFTYPALWGLITLLLLYYKKIGYGFKLLYRKIVEYVIVDDTEVMIGFCIDNNMKGIHFTPEERMNFLEQAAESGYISAMKYLSSVYDTSMKKEHELEAYEDDSKAILMYEKLSKEKEYAEQTSMLLGEMYRTGRGTSVNISKACSKYEIASSLGNVEARAILTELYSENKHKTLQR